MRPLRRGLVFAFLLALLLSAVVDQPMPNNTVVPDVCKTLTPDDWFWWWWYGCDKDAGGGGSSGAGD